MKIDLQPILDEMKQSRGSQTVKHPKLVKLFETHGYEAVNAALDKHWRDVDQGLTTEYQQITEILSPRQKQRLARYKLSDRLKRAGVDTFTQRQLDVAMMALGDVNGSLLPPVRTDLRDFEEAAQISVDVLVKVKNHASFSLGRYIHGLGEWQVNNMGGDAPDVTEWWPLPGEVS